MEVKDHMYMISAIIFSTPSGFRLKEIQMSEYDAATYERFSGAVRRQVHSLRVILDNLQVILQQWTKKIIWAQSWTHPRTIRESYPNPIKPVRKY